MQLFLLHEQKLRRKVLDYSKGSQNFWSFVKTHLIKDVQTFTHSVEKANILTEMFSENVLLSESDQPLPFTPWASCTMPEVHTRTIEVKTLLAKLDIKRSISKRTRWYSRSSFKNMFFVTPLRFAVCSPGTNCWKIANVQPEHKKRLPLEPWKLSTHSHML